LSTVFFLIILSKERERDQKSVKRGGDQFIKKELKRTKGETVTKKHSKKLKDQKGAIKMITTLLNMIVSLLAPFYLDQSKEQSPRFLLF
jgi:hypothetical protein